MAIKTVEQINAFNMMLVRQGGDLVFNDSFPAYEISSNFGEDARMSQIVYPEGYKPFIISIYDIEKNVDIVSLKMIINPTDIQIGQTFVINQSYTRNGWVPQIWGKQPGTISASGVCASFFLSTTGLTNYSRKDSIGFMNLQTLMSIFKNGGANYIQTSRGTENTIFKTGYSRVPNVLDAIKLSYDGTDYLGTFNTLTLNEEATKPYNLSYTFEFIYTGLLGDTIEGHIKTSQYVNTEPVINIQGKDSGFVSIINLSEDKIKELFAQNKEKIEDKYMNLENSYASDSGTEKSVTNKFTKFEDIPDDRKKSQYNKAREGVDLWKTDIDTYVKELNAKYNGKVTSEEIQRLFMIESGGVMYDKKGKVLRSEKDAIGISQVIPKTANGTNTIHNINLDYIGNEGDNMRMGIIVYMDNLKLYNGDREKAIAAYNGGTKQVDRAINKANEKGGNWQDYLSATETSNYIKRYRYYQQKDKELGRN